AAVHLPQADAATYPARARGGTRGQHRPGGGRPMVCGDAGAPACGLRLRRARHTLAPRQRATPGEAGERVPHPELVRRARVRRVRIEPPSSPLEEGQMKIGPTCDPRAVRGDGCSAAVRPVRVCIVAPSLDLLGGQAVQAQRLLAAFAGSDRVHAGFLAVNPRLPGPLRALQGIKYVRTIVTSIAYVISLLSRVKD